MQTIIYNGNFEIQKKLDMRGEVEISVPGIYLINKPLVIYSGTRLYIRHGVIIKAADDSHCSLIENSSFYSGETDEDIEIVGGIWDGNCDGQDLDPLDFTLSRNAYPYDPRRFTGKLLRFAHIRNFTFRDATVKDPVSYGVQIADASGFCVSDIHFDYNCRFGTTDGIHINGPSDNGIIRRLHGITNDDMAALTTVDEDHAEITRGPIRNVIIDGVHAENGYTGVRLLSCGEPLSDIEVRNVSGTFRHNALSITHHYVHPGEEIRMENITVDGVFASKSSRKLSSDCFIYWDSGDILNNDPVIWVESGVNVGNLTIKNVFREEKTDSSAPTVRIDSGTHIEKLTVENIRHSFLFGQDFDEIIYGN
ncbi:MAG: hypothetical protein J5850_05435 [Clostridia bacterium]|nr:hypothetical protein [Clostridia bacterium]